METEYGLHIQGRGAQDQVEDATELVRSYPGVHIAAWDYRHESPRSDLRGFKVKSLSFDPQDAKFDVGKSYGPAHEIRADRVLPNGARLYNDHGHPEYSTPECWSLRDLADEDCAGQLAVLQAGKALEAKNGSKVSLYKNNTDYHGASYGTHESFLVPRDLHFDRLHAGVLPMLVARQILSGSGKVGSESKEPADFQLSQRADFFSEVTNVETLFRRPIFNTRDEPHAQHHRWTRLHVISGDANMIRGATARKVGLVKLAIALAEVNEAPSWVLKDPVKAFQSISRDKSQKFVAELKSGSLTNAHEILESYFSAAEHVLDLDLELQDLISSCRLLLQQLYSDPAAFRQSVDWAAKKFVLEQYLEQEGTGWDDPNLKSYDLEYHNLDGEESLFAALQSMQVVPEDPPAGELQKRLDGTGEGTRARARGLAVSKFKDQIETLSWSSIVFRDGEELLELTLPPDISYPSELEDCQSVGTFIEMIRGIA